MPVSRLFPDIVAAHPELSETRGRPTTVADAVARLKRTVERQPSGAEVAVWFGRGSGFALAGDLKGRAEDEPPEAPASPDWGRPGAIGLRLGLAACSIAKLFGQDALVEAVVGIEHHQQIDLPGLLHFHADDIADLEVVGDGGHGPLLVLKHGDHDARFVG